MRFRINYSRVISQAESISENAAQLSHQLQLLSQMEQDCRAVWKGDAAETFLRKLMLLEEEIRRTRTQMSNLASTIKYCADTIQNEDQEAARLAASLTAGV